MRAGATAEVARRRLGLAVLLGAAWLAYGTTLSVPFVFDDGPAIRDNPTIRSLASWRVLSPPVDSGVGGRPLANLSFALNHAWGGSGVTGYHVVNVALHACSALLLFGCVRRTVEQGGCGRAEAVRSGTNLALAAALLWMVHPLHTGAVTYLSQRTELLMGCCYLATLYCFIRGWWIGAVAACAAGMLSKETMVTAPLVMLCYDRTFVAGSFAAAWRARGRVHLALAATWGALGWALASDLSRRSVGFGLGVSAWDYALNSCVAVWRYLQLAIWPAGLVFDYGPLYNASAVATAGALGLAAASVWLAWRRPAAGFFPLVFLLLLAPTTSVVPVADQPLAENRMYLPLAALATGVVAALLRFVAPVPGRVAVVAVAAALLSLTLARNAVYRSPLTLWRDTAWQRPLNPRAHYNLGVVATEAGELGEARRALARAIELKPDDGLAHLAYGHVLRRSGEGEPAWREYAEAVRLRPDLARAWHARGAAALQLGRLDAARADLERALALQPEFAEAWNDLGNVEFQSGRPEEAIGRYEAALRLDPAIEEAHYNAGSASFDLGRFDAAVRHFQAAAAQSPDDAAVWNFLGAALLRAGRAEDAVRAFEEALRLDPRQAEARDNLAAAREALRRGR